MKVLFVSSGNSRYGIIPFIKSQGESIEKEGVGVEYFAIKKKGFKGYLSSIISLRSYLKNKSFDLIHAHYGLTGLVCVMALTGIPIILSIMGDDAYGDYNSKGKRIKSSYIGMILTQITQLFVQGIIVKSRNILDYALFKRKCFVIPNGVDFELFKPDSKELNQNQILFLGDETLERKNFKLFKKAIDLLDEQDVSYKNPYPISQVEFPNYLNQSSVFVLTSFNEGSPNVIKEAMACNIPIVSTDVGDVREVIGNTEGCFIASFEPEDVADKIKKALDFGKRTTGRKDIEHLESSTVAKKIIDIYHKVLEK